MTAYAKIRHFIVAYVRSLAATRLLSAISILGLAIGLTGVIVMALVTRAALGYNGFVPDNDRIYLGYSVMGGPGMAPNHTETSNVRAAALIEANIPGVEAVVRLAAAEVDVRRGGDVVKQRIYWADPDTFAVLRLPAVEGDPVSALARPDGVVMTASEAEKHFGRGVRPGASIEIAGQPMILRAVIADLPAHATDLDRGVFVSGLAVGSEIAPSAGDAPGSFSIGVRSYLRLRPGTSPQAVEQRMKTVVAGLVPSPLRNAYSMRLVRIDRLALHEAFHPTARERLQIGTAVAALILFVAVANFVNLSVALSARRRREIGVRRASGAGRRHIAGQFLGEAVATVIIAGCLAASAVELLLPRFNAFMETHATFDYVGEPTLILWLLPALIVLGLVAGAYPAVILSSLPPVAALKTGAPVDRGRGLLRSTLVAAQFAVLITLIIATAVVHQQRRYAMDDALRTDVDQVLTVAAQCPAGFRTEVAKLPGVRAVSCGGAELLDGQVFAFIQVNGSHMPVDVMAMLPSGFALLGVAPVAGSLSGLPADGDREITRAVINETASRRLGYASPEAAIGQQLPSLPVGADSGGRMRVAAVVPDFAFYSVETAIEPAVYLNRPAYPGGKGLVLIRLSGRSVPETLRAIDRLWGETGGTEPIERAFLSDHIEGLYRDLERNTQLFAAFAGVAAFLACLGLIGLSVSIAERRTKEIGVRKALGARTDQILALLLWQIGRPIVWANLIAWPAAWWLMRSWLDGFAYRVPLQAWLFPTAGVIAAAIAAASIGAQSFAVARRKPAVALRYE